MPNIIYFASVSLIVIISLSIILKILIKKFDPSKSKVQIYGLLQGLSNREIISISCYIILYIFVLYIMFSFIKVDYYILIVTTSLVLLGGILIKNKYLIIDILLSLLSTGGLQIVYLLYDYQNNEYQNVWLLLLQVFVMIFLFLYYTYFLLRSLKNAISHNKYVRKGGK